ncbi:MAG: DUF454 family protein [Pseudohongiellaceae bacterium]
MKSNGQHHPMPWFLKVVTGFLIAGLLVIGMLGLILPIIPGLLFLFIAALLLTRVSRRFAAAAEKHPGLARPLRFWRTAGGLSVPQRLRLAFWVVAKATVNGFQTASSLLRRKRSQ